MSSKPKDEYLICVDSTDLSLSLTVGKSYKNISNGYIISSKSSYETIKTINDRGIPGLYSRKLFKSSSEIRDEKLEKIGI